MNAAGRTVAIMGATGSIGRQALEVLVAEGERFELVAIAGGRRLEELARVATQHRVRFVGVPDDEAAQKVRQLVDDKTEILVGESGLRTLSAMADIVINGVVGFAGLPVTLATLEAGKRLALANKESLIAAAPLVAQVRTTPGAAILPVDSEHCAIHQCLAATSPTDRYPDVAKLILTASGGPFRGMSHEQLSQVTKAEALAHPTWSMGEKITIDSSTLMNKGLEVLEASALFDVEVDRIDVVVHPQSIVHSMVAFRDGAVLAQLSKPDMRLPISYCLGLPARLTHPWGAIDFTQSFALDFEAPDREAFPALDLAYAAARVGGAAPAWLSAANEVAVQAFLEERIMWREIVPVVASVMDKYVADPLTTLDALYENDAIARKLATDTLKA